MAFINDLNSEVASKVTGANQTLQANIADILAQEEITRRTTAGVATVKELRAMESEYRKLKPDIQTFDENHQKTGESYSAKVNEERKKLEEKIEKYSKALEKGLTKGDFGDLFNLVEKK